MDRSLLQRIVLIAVALPICAWLAVGLVGTRREADARPVLERASRGPIPEAQLQEGRDLLRQARRLSVDTEPLYAEAVLLTAAGRREEALAVLRRLVDDEPDNFEAWLLIFAITSGRSDEALERVRELNPWAADRLERIRPGSP